MDDASLHSLIQAATKNHSLVLLDVRNNCNLTESLVEKLDEVLKNNSLKMLLSLPYRKVKAIKIFQYMIILGSREVISIIPTKMFTMRSSILSQ
jgi:hypothetical protein